MAEDLAMTAFLVIRIGDEAVTIESVEPRTTSAHVAYRPGSRHAIQRGAPGLALLAGRPAVRGERREVAMARERGWSASSGEVTPGLASVACWVMGADGQVAAAIACVYLAGAAVDVASISSRVCSGALAVTHTIGGSPMIDSSTSSARA